MINELTHHDASLLKAIATPKEILHYHDDMVRIVQQVLVVETDYGILPGTKKNTLFKPGAERINMAFGTYPEYELIEKEIDHDRETKWVKEKKVWNNAHQGDKTFRWEVEEGTSLGLYRYVYKCRLFKRNDHMQIGEADGSCSTMESKYVDRPRDLENNILKMAQKRAYISATLLGFGLSERFHNMISAKVSNIEVFDSSVPEKVTRLRAALVSLKKTISEDSFEDLIHLLEGKPFLMADVEKAVNKISGSQE